MTFNTHAAFNRLVAAGMKETEAETMLAILAERDEASGAGLATKADLHELRAGLLQSIYFALLAQTVGVVGLSVGLTVTLIKVLH